MRAGTLLIALLLIGSFIPLTSGAGEKPLVVTSIAPLAAIVQDAFGDSVEVVYIIPLGADPHEYQLTASQIELLRQADIIVTTGGHLPVEKKIAELKAEGTITGEALFIDDYKANGFRYLKEHWYNEKDNPHGIWLDPYNALAIAQATEKALEKADPHNAELYRKGFECFNERVITIVESYRAILTENLTAIIQMPSNQYALEWLGITAVASIKPEEEVPALGVDELVEKAAEADLIVYGHESPEQLTDAAKELAVKSRKSPAEITVFWKDRPYTEVLIENSAAVIKALEEKPPEKLAEARTDVTRYVVVSIIVGLVLGTALGVILKK
ncbi:metal ABC transporter solute-binding protein, Zn/Mn family [Thermococcus piezophilus]|uniref:ABC transporter substrate-binding protein n=1 Tax=Thermococcus piezophilus TaxID=1712654 RepID=A0A172WIZ5_9EURY|nr:zinc ABC transporter substrate-binding protein [Thermococcus piezophilus]ANF23296.1 ABC transporter substrate-binding protein [Thermococcus piezophilus]